MVTVKIHLKSISEVTEFVKIANTIPCDVDLSSERYVVDAKSIMGLLSLDLSHPVAVTIHCTGPDNWSAKFNKFISNK